MLVCKSGGNERGTEMRAEQLFLSCCVIAVAVAAAAGQDSDFGRELLVYEGQSFEEREDQGEWLRADLTEFLHHLFPLVSEFMRNNDLDPLTIRDIRRSFWMVGKRSHESWVCLKTVGQPVDDRFGSRES